MTWVTCKCIRVSLTRDWGWKPVSTGTSSSLHIANILSNLAARTLFYALDCSDATAVLLLDFEANGRFEETERPITRYGILLSF